MKELKQVRETLIEMLEDLDDRLLTITDGSKQNAKPVKKDVEYQAFGAENDEAVDISGGAIREEMEQIKLALSRIDEGTYGICLSCGQTIKQRLKENIFSWLCIDCTKKGAFSNKVK